MPLHGIGHSRSQSHTSNAPVSDQPLASLVQAASQTLTGIGNPAALVGGGATNTSTSRLPNSNQNSGLRLQTSNAGNPPGSQQNSGITPIHSGGSSIISPDSALPPKKSISFRLPSPVTQPGSSGSSRSQQQQQQQRHSQQEQLYQDHPSSATQSHPHHLSQRPSDPTQKQQISSQQPSSQQPTYTAYHSANPSSNTGSRPHISSTSTAPAAVPQASQQRSSMHRTNTSGGGGGSGYSPNAQLNPGGGGDVGGSRKYNHPGALTPTYPSSSQHTTSHSHSGVGSQGIGLTGSSNSSNSMREPQESYGAVGPGRWMCPYGLYAIDWCKWNPSASGGYGRVAVGSYTEDSHNYVGTPLSC